MDVIICPVSDEESLECFRSTRGSNLLNAVEIAFKKGKLHALIEFIEERTSKRLLVSPDLLDPAEEKTLVYALTGFLFHVSRLANIEAEAILVGHGSGDGSQGDQWYVGPHSVQEWMETYNLQSLHVVACEDGIIRTTGGISGRLYSY